MKAECEAARAAFPELLVLPGKELGRFHPLGNHGHCLAYGLDDYADAGPRSRGRAMVDAVRAARGFGIIAHPDGSAFPIVLGAWLFRWRDWTVPGYTGVELLNKGKCAGYAFPGRGWDRHLAAEVPERMQGLLPGNHPCRDRRQRRALHPRHREGEDLCVSPRGAERAESLYTALQQGRCVARQRPVGGVHPGRGGDRGRGAGGEGPAGFADGGLGQSGETDQSPRDRNRRPPVEYPWAANTWERTRGRPR